jgi:hypothetical protein
VSIRTFPSRGQFRPESVGDFSRRSRRLSTWLGLAYQQSQELLARIYGYSNFHELRVQLERPGSPGPFDDSGAELANSIEKPRSDHETRITQLIAQCKGISVSQLTLRDRAVASMGLFQKASQHRATFKALTKRTQNDLHNSLTLGVPESPRRRRVVTAPLSSRPGLPSVVLDVECGEDEDIEWLWTETPEGRYVSGYRLVSLILPPAPAPQASFSGRPRAHLRPRSTACARTGIESFRTRRVSRWRSSGS